MKKNAFLTLFCLLLALFAQAQQTNTVINGRVVFVSDGSPVADHEVFAFGGDSINPVFGQALTDNDGNYQIDLDLPAGFNTVYVSSITNCDPANFFSTIEAVIVNGGATANFEVCNDSFPPLEECFADFYALPTDSLTFQFYGYYYSWFDSTQTGVSYLWDFGDGATSTEENPVHTYAQDGLYIVTLTITGSDGCVATVQYPLETSFNPFPECMGYILYNQLDITTFEFNSELYDNQGNLVDADSYEWDFGDGETSTESNPTHTYVEEGVYTVQLHAVTEDGCEIHSCDVVFAFDCPVDTFWYGCQAMFWVGYQWDSTGIGPDPLTLSFFDQSLGGVTSWNWNFGDGATSTEQNPVHTYAADGVYEVTLAITTVDGCESEVSFEICVGANCWTPEFDCQALFIPVPDSLGGNGIQFLDLSFAPSPIQTWTWDFGDGSTSSEQNPYHEYAQPGIYTVSLTIVADSCNSVISFEIDTQNPWNFNRQSGEAPQLGVSGNALATRNLEKVFESAKVFPNPAVTDLSVAFNSRKAGDYEIRITDLTGKTLLRSFEQATAGVNTARVNIAQLLPGLYLAELKSGDAVQTIKFTKQ